MFKVRVVTATGEGFLADISKEGCAKTYAHTHARWSDGMLMFDASWQGGQAGEELAYTEYASKEEAQAAIDIASHWTHGLTQATYEIVASVADIAGYDIVCDDASKGTYSCESYQTLAEAEEVLAAYVDDAQAGESFRLVPLTQAEWDERYN